MCPSDLRTLRIPQLASPKSVGVNDNDDDGRLGTVTRWQACGPQEKLSLTTKLLLLNAAWPGWMDGFKGCCCCKEQRRPRVVFFIFKRRRRGGYYIYCVGQRSKPSNFSSFFLWKNVTGCILGCLAVVLFVSQCTLSLSVSVGPLTPPRAGHYTLVFSYPFLWSPLLTLLCSGGVDGVCTFRYFSKRATKGSKPNTQSLIELSRTGSVATDKGEAPPLLIIIHGPPSNHPTSTHTLSQLHYNVMMRRKRVPDGGMWVGGWWLQWHPLNA